MKLLIRKARPDEATLLGEIGYAAWAASAFAANDAGRVDRERLQAEFRGFFDTNAALALVAELDGHAVGWGAREHDDQRISDLWMAPAAQGKGIGGQLLAALICEIRAAGYALVELETLAQNEKAIAFYHRHGFSIVWRRETFSATLGYAIDKVGMNKSLSP